MPVPLIILYLFLGVILWCLIGLISSIISELMDFKYVTWGDLKSYLKCMWLGPIITCMLIFLSFVGLFRKLGELIPDDKLIIDLRRKKKEKHDNTP